MHTVYGISLGPGDPELLTIKALRLLKESDMIFYPGSLYADGRKESYVLPMLKYHGVEESRLEGFFLQMSLDRTNAEKIYEETAEKVAAACIEGKKVSIVCEGDLSFYASFSYLLTRLKELKLPIELVPGINSFSLGAAKHQVPVSLQNERIAILPLETDIDKIDQSMMDFDTVILMKIRFGWKSLYENLILKDWKFYYCERLGTEQEFITSDLTVIKDSEIPYFSLLIIKK
ncbi:MAG: precorrin-2 C(20)-methyltransferase [Opitutaceae bacterium]|nr:precorrin-2 C(20)-methyltransferase [Cytophagales bacterium]